ncbi:hypothetical protein BDR06DRAFT_955223 [Suillus hirtellus]|nr:hypothetical protein BDR06DRAFT_955223 [Suillus hirtellus]
MSANIEIERYWPCHSEPLSSSYRQLRVLPFRAHRARHSKALAGWSSSSIALNDTTRSITSHLRLKHHSHQYLEARVDSELRAYSGRFSTRVTVRIRTRGIPMLLLQTIGKNLERRGLFDGVELECQGYGCLELESVASLGRRVLCGHQAD